MLNVFAVAGQAPLVSLRSHVAGDDSSSLARRAIAAFHSRAAASVAGGCAFEFGADVCAPALAARTPARARSTSVDVKDSRAFIGDRFRPGKSRCIRSCG